MRAGVKTENRDQDIVIYDGQCNFCRGQVENLRRLDGKNRFQFVSLHDPAVSSIVPDLSFEQLMEQMWIVTANGKRYGGADSMRYLSRRLPILWPLMPILHLPGTRPLWRWAYRKIAKARYRIAGKDCDEGGTCSLHR